MPWIFAALLLLAQEGTITITVVTKDGNTVSGATDVTKFTLESSLGKSSIALKDVAVIRLIGGEIVVSTGDGTSLKGKLSQNSWKVVTKIGEFNIKMEDIVQITVQGFRPAPVAPGVPAPAPAAPGAPPKPAANPALQPSKTLKLGVAIPRMIRTTDGKKLYLLDATDAKVHVVDLEKFQEEKAIALAGGETAMSLSPSGSVLVAGGKRIVSVASPSQGKMLKSFAVEVELTDLCVVDDQTVVACGGGPIVAISIAKQAIVSKTNYSSGGFRLYLSRDGKKIHTGSGSILLPDKAQGREELTVSSMSMGNTPQELFMSPDGRFASSPHGSVYRLGKSFVADIIEIAKVEQHWASAWSPGSKTLFVVNSAGFVKEYDLETWEMRKSWFLGWRMTELFTNEAGTVMTGIGQVVPAGRGDAYRYANQPPPPGDLVQFEIPK